MKFSLHEGVEQKSRKQDGPTASTACYFNLVKGFHDATFAYVLVSLPSASVRFKASIAHKLNASCSDAKNASTNQLEIKNLIQ